MLLDETYARKFFERKNPEVDFEEAKEAEEKYLKLKTNTDILQFSRIPRKRSQV